MYLDTTDNQLRIATSTTNADGAVVGKAINRLYSFSVPSTSDDWINAFAVTLLPPETDGFIITGIMCQATGTALSAFDVTITDGTNAMTAVECGTVRPTLPTSTTVNNYFTAGEQIEVRYSAKEGVVDDALISIFGIWKAE